MPTTALSRSFIWSLLGTGLPLLLGVMTIPTVMEGLGYSRFGLLTLVWTAIGYFGLFDFGLGRALTQRVASQLALNGRLGWADVVPGLQWVCILGIVGGFVMGGVSWYYLTQVLTLNGILLSEGLNAALWASLSIPLVTLGSGLRGILEGQEAFGRAAWLRGLLGGLNFGLPWLLVVLGSHNLVDMVMSLVLARLVVLVWNLLWLRPLWLERQYLVSQRPASVKDLFSFGAWMTVSNLVGPFMVAADRFIVASLVGTGVLAFYTVPQDTVLRLLVIPAAWATVWFPRFAGLASTASAEALRTQLWSGIRWMVLCMGGICLVLALFAQPLLTLWLGRSFADQSTLVTQVLLVGLFFNALAHIPLAALQASGRVALTAQLHVVELLLFVPMLFWVIPQVGLIGAAWVWTGRTVVDFVFLLGFSVQRHDGSKL